METTLLSASGHDWLVVGSDGAIGSELTTALLLSSPTPGVSAVRKGHPHDSYRETVTDVLRARRDSGRPLRLLFCGGKGGFSLSKESAEKQHEAFDLFCRDIGSSFDLEKFVFISSLGARCSQLVSHYSSLIEDNEQTVQNVFHGRSLILRLPSMYGYSFRARRFHGLVGIMLRNLRIRRPTGIYARLETRRNYLSIHRLAPLLVRQSSRGGALDQTGILNVQSTVGLSILDVCTHFFRAIKQRPILKLVRHSQLDEEHHYPSKLTDAKLCVIDPIGEWVSLHWKRSAPLSPL